MLVHIGDKTYSATDALRRPTLNNLFELKVKTRSEAYPEGVSVIRLKEYLLKLNAVKAVADLVDDADTMLGLKCLLFLTQRYADVPVTFEEAGNVTLDQIVFETEESDAVLIEEARSKRGPFGKGRRASAPAGA